MRNILLLLVSFPMSVSPVAAQLIHGTVRDEAARPVVDAEVVLMGGNGIEHGRTATDSAGVFRVPVQAAGGYALQVTRIGFAAFLSDPVRVGTVETVTVEVRLGRAAIPLNPIRVTARHADPRIAAFHERRLRGAGGRFLTRADIENGSQVRTTDMLRRVPGITIVPVVHRGSVRASNMISVRGATPSCQPALFIDGVRTPQHPLSTMDDILTPASLEGVEVYTAAAAAPVEFTGQSSCGVILFWTRSGSGAEGTRLSWVRALAVVGGAATLIFFLR